MHPSSWNGNLSTEKIDLRLYVMPKLLNSVSQIHLFELKLGVSIFQDPQNFSDPTAHAANENYIL